MELCRIDSDRTVSIPCDRITLKVGDKEYTLTEDFGKLMVHTSNGRLTVRPCVANEITIDIDKD